MNRSQVLTVQINAIQNRIAHLLERAKGLAAELPNLEKSSPDHVQAVIAAISDNSTQIVLECDKCMKLIDERNTL